MLEVAVRRKMVRAASGEVRPALGEVAFRLEDGEVGAVVGPSGCGKTTLLRIVSGLEADFEGEVRLPEPRGIGQKIGMVFQEPRLLPWRSVRRNLVLAGAQDGPRLDALAATLGLAGHLDHYPGELSLGLARRAAIARAFAVEPTLLLLDEPFVSLDAALALKLREQLAALVEARRATTLIVTHDLDEAVALADRVFVLSPAPGRLVADVPIAASRARMPPEEAVRTRARLEAIIAQAAHDAAR
ncbi:ABC transporter ATP-binding protein [Methylocella sp.]|uniref:ABC transporter ATP-binding protein n=1 Tax=Methylocella sp. TaxID=1978226 RepID=UPI003782E301